MLFDTPYRGPELDFDPGHVPVHFHKRGRRIDFALIRKIIAHPRAHQPRAVHGYNDTAIFYAALARMLGGGGYRIVGTFHTWPSHPTTKARYAARWATSRIENTVAVSKNLRDRLVRSHWVGECDVIPNGVELDRFAPSLEKGFRAELNIPENAFLVGNIARFHPVKRQKDLVEAAQILQRTAPHVILLLVGEGPTSTEIRHLAGACPNVRFLGATSQIPRLLLALDAFVLSSEYEAAPLVILEAMASGLPVIATRVGGIVEMVGEGQPTCCALLVPPASSQKLAEAIQRLTSDAALRSRLSLNAVTRAADRSFEVEWRAYQKLYGF